MGIVYKGLQSYPARTIAIKKLRFRTPRTEYALFTYELRNRNQRFLCYSLSCGDLLIHKNSSPPNGGPAPHVRREETFFMRISSTSLWIPQKFMCRWWSPWLFNPFPMKSFEEFCHTDSFSLSNPLYFGKRTQTDTDICCLDVYLSSLTFLNQKVLF